MVSKCLIMREMSGFAVDDFDGIKAYHPADNQRISCHGSGKSNKYLTNCII